MNSHYLPDEWITPPNQINDIEPEISPADAVRDARVKCVQLLNAFAAHIEAALLRPGAQIKDVAIAFYQPVYALGLNIADGTSMTERSQHWEVERATISKGAIAFCNGNGLPPSFYMKDESAQKSYQNARVKSIKECNQKKSRAA